MLEACQKEYQKIYFKHENLKKIYQQLEQQQQQQQQQRPIKNLPQRIKNKKRYFITDVNKNENDYENDDDNYHDEDDEVEYIKVKKNTNKKNVQPPKIKAKQVQKGIIDYLNNIIISNKK